MRKILTFLALATLTACAPNPNNVTTAQPDNSATPIKINVTRLPTHLSDRMNMVLLCIDGVKYMMIPNWGITVKYYHDGVNDPYPEICVNSQQ